MRKRISLEGIGVLILMAFIACKSGAQEQKKLPFLGKFEVSEAGDTLYQTLPDFAFWDQDSTLITAPSIAGKIWVSDFFFTSCPTICPKMSMQMIRVHDEFMEEPEIILLSHTIDPRHDTVAVLKAYANNLGIHTAKWHLLTGEQDDIYALAEAYRLSAVEDPYAPGGFIHSGAFALVDKKQRIRGFYDGTDEAAVDQLILDIKELLAE